MILLLSYYVFASTLSFDRAMFIGDSHSNGEFGKVIDAYLRETSGSVLTIASCGSSPSTWMRTDGKFQTTNCGYWRRDPNGYETNVKSRKIDSFEFELNNLKPNLTVIALGTNMLSSLQNIKRELAHVESMLKKTQAVGSKCVWVGPPDAGKEPLKSNLKAGVLEIKAMVEKYNCSFIDSTKYTNYTYKNSDGMHYGPNGARTWGNAVREELKLTLKNTVTPTRPPRAESRPAR